MLDKRLNKKISIYFVGMFASKIFPFLLIPIHAFYLSSETIGYYDLINTVMGIAVPFLYVAIWEAILKFILSETNKENKINFISSSATFIIFVSLLIFSSTLIFEILFVNYNVNFILIGIMFISHALAITWQYYARALGFNRLYAYTGIIGTIVNFIFAVLLIIIIKLDLNGLMIPYILGQLSIFIFIEIKIKIIDNISFADFKASTMKQMLMFSFPLVINLTSTWLMSAFGRILILTKLGAETNGLFSFANRFSLIISMIGSVVTMAMIEEAIISVKTTGFDSKFRKTIESIFKIFQSLAIAAVPLITVFYFFIQQTEFYSSYKFAPWLLIYAVSNTLSQNIGSVFQAINKTKYQFFTTVIGATVTVLLSSLLIDKIGVYAVIIGQIFGSVSILLSRYLFVNQYVNLKINWKPIINMTFLFVVVTMLCLYTHYVVTLIIIPLTLYFIGFLNREYLNEVFNWLKDKLVKK